MNFSPRRFAARVLSVCSCSTLLVLLFALACCVPAYATTFTVTNTLDPGAGACTASTSGDGCTLREAIFAANTQAGDDVIAFAAGVTGTIQLTSELPAITTNIDLQGLGARSLTVAGNAPQNIFRVFTLGAGTTVGISGLTISGGATNTEGGGIRSDGTLSLRRCVIAANVTLVNANTGRGAGLYSTGPLTVADCLFVANLVNTTQSRDDAYGGAIYVTTDATVQNSTFVLNTASNGQPGTGSSGAPNIVTQSGTLRVQNCTFRGGGVGTNGSAATARVSNNIFGGDLSQADTDISLKVFGGGSIVSEGSNLASDNGGGFLTATGDRINAGASLASLADNGGPTNTFALNDDSLAINAGIEAQIPPDRADADGDGNTSEPSPFDQRGPGFARVSGGRVDIGAFEVALQDGPNFVVNTTEGDDDGLCADADCSLSEAINAANTRSGADTITFSVSGTIILSADLPTLSSDLTITGPSSGITVSGNNTRQLFRISGGTVNLNTFTVANGRGVAAFPTVAGGVQVIGGSVTLRGLTLMNNRGSDSPLNAISIYAGAGAVSVSGGSALLVNCTLNGNTGGAILGPPPNTGAPGSAGGAQVTSGTLTLAQCTVTSNTGGSGGDSSNGTSGRGGPGGILSANGGLTIANSIVFLNTGGAGGTSNVGSNGGTGPANTQGSITLQGQSITLSDPQLGPLQNNGGPTLTRLPIVGSQAIDAGVNQRATQYGATIDQRGLSRFIDGDGNGSAVVDIGAVEAGQASAVRLITFEAKVFSDGVWLHWRTGWESDNLGFHLYRQVRVNGKWQRAARLNPGLIAGSALLNGANASPQGGFVYGWADKQATPSALSRYGRQNVRYWLQDVDVRGKTVNHGPVSAAPGSGGLSGKRNSKLVSELGR